MNEFSRKIGSVESDSNNSTWSISNGKSIVLMIPICLIMIILIASFTSALGVTPARTVIDFSPGLEQTISFSVVNSEHKDIDLVIYIQGNLNESISLPLTSFSMTSDEETRQLSYNLKLPDTLEPGPHSADIVILQLSQKSSTGQSFVDAAVAVATQVVVNVPYPGKYAQAALNVVNAEKNGDATFIIPVLSLGDLDLARVSASIDIYNKLNEKVASFNTAEISVLSGERKDLVAKWKANVSVGEYFAKAVLVYDGETINLEAGFNVGSAVLELQQITVRDFSLGEIAKMEMLVENKWSEPIIGAYTEMQVFNENNQIMAELKSPTYNINPFEKADMVSYWDTAGVKAGIFDTIVYLKYSDKSIQQNIQLKVEKNSITAIGLGFVISESRGSEGGNVIIILAIVIGILVLINIAWFFVFRKRMKK